MLPLYAGYPPPGAQGNAGLRFEKFFDLWNEKGDGIPDGARFDWVKRFSGSVGEKDQLDEYANRTRKLKAALRGKAFTAKTQDRLIAGTGRSHPIEVGFAWHHTLGVPYIPGSGLKGIVKTWAEEWENRNLDDLLGVMERVGQVVFLDALPTEPVTLKADVMTPHYGEYYRGETPPGDWLSPNPIPFLTVAKGQKFLFAVVPADPGHIACCKPAMELLQQALAELGAGAKTAAGYGRFGAFTQE
ncbi:MAG: type III-B CRISPR module RAMP protein Cmr6 [Defluviicoccus sp.]|nr:type III-B CRISPR module RAMP protein Cmr6 [Defluviicoccus sp.]MDG4592290.1 type III-B CRISPR module RAMP protein Cmr6 [Defluviicoccus sp.]